MRAEPDALTESLLAGNRPRLSGAKLSEKHCERLAQRTESVLDLILLRMEMLRVPLFDPPPFTLAAEVHTAWWEYHKLLNAYGMPGGDHICSALLDFELIRLVELAGEHILKEHEPTPPATIGANVPSSVARAARRLADIPVVEARMFFEKLKDSAYDALLPNTPDWFSRGDMQEASEARVQRLRAWFRRHEASPMNHSDPIAEVKASSASSSSSLQVVSPLSQPDIHAQPSSRVIASLPPHAAVTAADTGSTKDVLSSLGKPACSPSAPDTSSSIRGPWEGGETWRIQPDTMVFSDVNDDDDFDPMEGPPMASEADYARLEKLSLSVQDAAAFRTSRAPSSAVARKRKRDSTDPLELVKISYLDFVSDMTPVASILHEELGGTAHGYQDRGRDQPVVDYIEFQLWHWYLWLVAIGIPHGSFELAALYMCGRIHAVEHKAQDVGMFFHGM